MFTLIIDTCTDKSLVIWTKGEQILLNLFLPVGAQTSRHLMSMIESGFQKLKLNPDVLEALAVGTGPGSYTGIRVGTAAASGLAFPKSLPLVSFCSLEGFITEEEGPFGSFIDARIGGAYVLLQERVKNKIVLQSPPQFVTGENLSMYTAQHPIKAGPQFSYPDPKHLAHLVAQKLNKGDYSSDIKFFYLRTPDYTRSS